MILKTALLIKLLLPAAMLAAGCRFLRRKVTRAWLLGLGALTIVFAFAANAVSGLVPPLLDEVTLAALDQKNEASRGAEVYLTGCTVDGKSYTAGDELEILSGKWFWRGNDTYCWRSKLDKRQPEGVTDTITVGIPVGWGRTLEFESSEWRGLVEITFNGRTQTLDTYSQERGTARAVIGGSGKDVLILDQIRRLAVYALFLAALSAAAYTVLVWKRESVLRFNRRHRGVLIFLAIALAQMAFAMKYAGTDGLWYDELCEIGWSVRLPNLFQRAFTDAVPRPISEFILGAWIAIAPYGEKWILLLPELWTAAGIFLVGLCGKAYKNVRTGVFAALFAAVSGTVVQQCSFEMRSYGLYFATAAALLYLYIRRYTASEPRKRGEKIALCAVMVVFSQTHYYAYVFCAALFLFDAFAHWGLKCKKMSWTPYIVLGICTIPSAVMVLRSRFLVRYVSDNWQPVPTPGLVNGLINYFASNSEALRLLFFLAAAMLVGAAMRLFAARRERIAPGAERLAALLPIYLVIFQIAFFLIYGNIRSHATLWVNRYFCCLMPCFFVLCGYAANGLVALAGDLARGKREATAMCSVFILCAVLLSAGAEWEDAAVRIRERYREAIDTLYRDINYVFNDSTLILSTSSGKDAAAGLDRYYVTKYGKRDSLNILPALNIPRDAEDKEELQRQAKEEILQYDRVYVLYVHEAYPDYLSELLNEHYTKISDYTALKLAVYTRE